MKLNKPKFWNKKNSLISILLIPVTLVVIVVIFLKKILIKSKKFNIPIICVGNIYIGGTGKTPTCILLAKELAKLGKKPVILRKFYKSHVDEHDLIKVHFKNLILNKDRINGIKLAEKEKYDVVILDDGFQDRKIKKNLNIICFNQKQLIGNGLILPSGPLREGLKSLNKANIILINGKKDKNFEDKVLSINKDLEIFYSNYRPLNIDKFKGKKLFAVAGIANPNNFFQLIEENGLTIEKKLIFPDHYEFTRAEIEEIMQEAKDKNYQIVMTEKDYFKIKKFNMGKIEYFEVLLEVNNKEKFLNTIIRMYDQNN